MNKQAVQDWIDAFDRLAANWRRNVGPGNRTDYILFYEDPNYDNLKKYLAQNTPDASLEDGIGYVDREIDFARELIKMPDEQWDLFVLSGFKYYRGEDE